MFLLTCSINFFVGTLYRIAKSLSSITLCPLNSIIIPEISVTLIKFGIPPCAEIAFCDF